MIEILTTPSPDAVKHGVCKREPIKPRTALERELQLIFHFFTEMRLQLLDIRKIGIIWKGRYKVRESRFANLEAVVSVDVKCTVIEQVMTIFAGTNMVGTAVYDRLIIEVLWRRRKP